LPAGQHAKAPQFFRAPQFSSSDFFLCARIFRAAMAERASTHAGYFSVNTVLIVQQTPFFLLAPRIDLLLVFARSSMIVEWA
jgi:hypothetical protein